MPKPTDVLGKLLDMFERLNKRRDPPRPEPRGRSSTAERVPKAPPVSELFQQLKSGELTLNVFLEHKTREAVTSLSELLPQEDLEFLRVLARERLEDDPILSRLVARIRRSAPER